MLRAWSWFAVGSLATAELTLGCATDRDARSLELVAVSHLVTPPVGLLSVADDRTYSFTDPARKAVSKGTLSEPEFDTLKSHVSSSALTTLYASREADTEQCQRDGSYIVTTTQGSACFIVANVREPNARASIEFFSMLFLWAASQ
jgi:hypothetical protein